MITHTHPRLEIGEIFNGPKDMEHGEGLSSRQASIYRHGKKTWFVCSALTMPGWKELEHTFFHIIEGDHRMIAYPREWIAQFNDRQKAWSWFGIMNSGIKLSNAEWHLKMVKIRRLRRETEREEEILEDPEEIIQEEIVEEEKPKPKEPGQGDLFGE